MPPDPAASGPAPDLNSGPEALPDRLTALAASESLEETLDLGTRLLADVSSALSTAVFLMTAEGVVSRTYPYAAPPHPGLAELLHDTARDILGSSRNREATDPPSDGTAGTADGPETRVSNAGGVVITVRGYPLQTGAQTVGAAVMGFSIASPAEPVLLSPWVDTVIGVLVCRLVAHLERARSQAQKNHYERWFKTQDDQIRVLDRERQKFASIVNQTDACIFVVDKSGKINWTNKAAPVRFPPPGGAAGWIGRDGSDFCHTFKSLGENSDCSIREAMTSNAVVHREIRLAEAGGARQLYLTAVPIKGPDGQAHEVIINVQDLTDLHVVRQSERRYRVLFEQSANALLLVNPDSWGIVLANASAGRAMGCAPEELARLNLADLHFESDWAEMRQQYGRLLGETGTEGAECRLRTRDGRERVTTVYVQKFELDGRELMMLEVHDITARRHAEEALKAAEERLQAVVANSPLVLFALDRELRFTLSEGKGLRTLGLERGQLVGLGVEEVYGDYPQVVADVRRALTGEDFNDVVSVGHLTFDTWYGPIREESGEIVGVVGVATDVTASRELEKQLRHSQKMQAIGRLAGGVAHDFNNLLTVILGHCDLMIRGMEPASRWVRDTEAVQKAGTRGALLARQLLAFSRREVVAPQVLDLAELVGNVEPLLRRLIGEDIHLMTRLPERLSRIKADEGQVEQVLMNLAVNARDAMPRGGSLTIDVVPTEIAPSQVAPRVDLTPGPYVMMAVTDDGCGMDENTLEHLFDPFFTTKPMGEGTGLGLSIAYGIVQQYAGAICAESTPGEGSTIRIYFPLVEEATALPAPAPAESDLPSGSETILVVEDEDGVRAMTAEVLESQGYTVLQAPNAESALRLFKTQGNAIDLILTDVVMPGHDGAELATWLRDLSPRLKLMFMSGYTDDALARHGVLAEDHVFLQKPFRLDALLAKVREALDSEPGTLPQDRPEAAA